MAAVGGLDDRFARVAITVLRHTGLRIGELLDLELAPLVTATIHPSSILRQRDDESRYAEREAFAEDLRVVAKALAAV